MHFSIENIVGFSDVSTHVVTKCPTMTEFANQDNYTEYPMHIQERGCLPLMLWCLFSLLGIRIKVGDFFIFPYFNLNIAIPFGKPA